MARGRNGTLGTKYSTCCAVTRLNDIRTPATPRASTSSRTSLDGISARDKEDDEEDEPAEENRVDTILNDVFQVRPNFLSSY